MQTDASVVCEEVPMETEEDAWIIPCELNWTYSQNPTLSKKYLLEETNEEKNNVQPKRLSFSDWNVDDMFERTPNPPVPAPAPPSVPPSSQPTTHTIIGRISLSWHDRVE
ncbi:hypothetical protein NLJ89_g12149 [Agrocybe chaxingu]|uniref:Uncharacterized protein n=1 Tax=Agrocybe chaxingu TaxID=84603 RepID=A0A9W8JNN6_9AGAR|nr:hypothetical protein NLJ89_g12149 [Agrocybe chaxingu]